MIAIWGANGFIGRHLTHHLVQAGERVALFSRNYDGFPFPLPPSVETHSCDFLRPDTYVEELKRCHTVALLVSSSMTRTFSGDPEQEILLNVQPYRQFFDRLGNKNALPSRIIYISSGGGVYGMTEQISIPESHPLNPISPYGRGKLEIEALVRQASPSYTILRPANPVGIWNKRKSLLDYAIKAIKTGMPLEVFGDGEAVRDYFDVAELASAITLAADNPAAKNEIFNVGSEKGTTINQVIKILEDVHGIPLPRRNVPLTGLDVPFNVLDCGKIRRALGWSAQRNLQDILHEMWSAT
ncbi:MAG: NAD-dependent epimerase/dehydratase family protein [Alphaproteobacteria bacterium]